jgi:hypothetical protein
MSVSAVGSTSLDQLTLAQLQADQKLLAEDQAKKANQQTLAADDAKVRADQQAIAAAQKKQDDQAKTQNAGGDAGADADAPPSAPTSTPGSPQLIDVTV